MIEKEHNAERGFTMVELLISMAMISILAAISYTGFALYKDDAEYSKAENDLRNALTAAELGDQDAPSGYSAGPIASTVDGGPVSGALESILPGMVTSDGVRLTVSYSNCAGRGSMAQKHQIISTSCSAERYLSYLSLCGGIEVIQRNGAAGC